MMISHRRLPVCRHRRADHDDHGSQTGPHVVLYEHDSVEFNRTAGGALNQPAEAGERHDEPNDSSLRRWPRLLAVMPAAAQWRNLPKDGIPLGADGKPNMSAPAPRTIRRESLTSPASISRTAAFQNLADVGIENVPMTPEARKIHAARATGLLGLEEPDAHCLPQGVPRSTRHRSRSGSCRPTSSSSWSMKRSTSGARCSWTDATGPTI